MCFFRDISVKDSYLDRTLSNEAGTEQQLVDFLGLKMSNSPMDFGENVSEEFSYVARLCFSSRPIKLLCSEVHS